MPLSPPKQSSPTSLQNSGGSLINEKPDTDKLTQAILAKAFRGEPD
jgi:hypothetical protein